MAEIRAIIDVAPTIGGWISVKDRLPESEKNVFIFTEKGCVKRALYLNDGTSDPWYIFGNALGFSVDTITHWMPITEPPKEDDHG